MLIERELCLYFTALFNNRQQPASDYFNQFFTPKELNNREIIDGIHSTWSYFLDRNLDLPLNSFKTKAAAFCKRATDVVVVKLIIKFKFFTGRESKDRQTFECMNIMNSVKLKASLCQTLDVSNSKRMNQCLRYDFADQKIYDA